MNTATGLYYTKNYTILYKKLYTVRICCTKYVLYKIIFGRVQINQTQDHVSKGSVYIPKEKSEKYGIFSAFRDISEDFGHLRNFLIIADGEASLQTVFQEITYHSDHFFLGGGSKRYFGPHFFGLEEGREGEAVVVPCSPPRSAIGRRLCIFISSNSTNS